MSRNATSVSRGASSTGSGRPRGVSGDGRPTDARAVHARLTAAIARYERGEFAAAAACFADVLCDTPNHPTALRLRGLSLTRAGATAAALPLLARAWRLEPGEPLAHLHYGIGLQRAGRHARAAALFRRAATMLPDNPAPWTNLATALLDLGHGKAARAAARRAVALAPDTAACWHTLGLTQRAEGDIVAARDAFAGALKLDRGTPQIWVDYGLAAYQLGALDEGQAAMQTALAIDPTFAPATTNLAAFTLLRGDTDAAIGLLRDLLVRDPGSVAARLNLANIMLLENEAPAALTLLADGPPPGRDGRHWRAHRAMALLMMGRPIDARAELDAITQPYGDAEILVLWRRIVLAADAGDDAAAASLAARMETVAGEAHGALLEHRIIACFDLARFHNRRSRRADAFRNWQHGHSLLARSQPFSRSRFRAFIDAEIAQYTAVRLRDGPRADNIDPAPVFIVGLPRSGTSLTEQILAAHAQVHGAGERPAIHRLLNRIAGGAEIAEAVARAAALDAATLSSAATAYLADLRALAPTARFVTDKMPGNARHLGFIATLLPGARIIHCRRDPRDIGLSIFQHRFFGYHPYAHDLADLGWTIAQHARLMAHWRVVLTLPILEIALADWVHDFDGTLARLLAFLDLPHDPACERFYEQGRRVRTASARQVRQPINARGLGRWRDYAEHLAPMIDALRTAGALGDEADADADAVAVV